MTITISTFGWVPEFAQGYVRDLRIRWALTEAGLDYEEEVVKGPFDPDDPYRQWQPFGQMPAYRDDQVSLFESGAIVLYLAKDCEALAPSDAAGQAEVTAVVFAALNSLEPAVEALLTATEFHAGEAWADDYRPIAEHKMEERLAALAGWLGDKDFLLGQFMAGDLMMSTVLRSLDDWPREERFRALASYRARCIQRLAFRQALDAQLATYRKHKPSDV